MGVGIEPFNLRGCNLDLWVGGGEYLDYGQYNFMLNKYNDKLLIARTINVV